MRTRPSSLGPSSLLVTALVLWGCSSPAPREASSPQSATARQPIRPQTGVPGSVVRILVRGGTPVLYRLPGLVEVAGVLRGRLPAVERVVGLDPEGEFLYVQTGKRELLAFDLESGRIDTVATDIERAVLGPDRTLYAIDSGRKVVSMARRVRFVWPQALAALPTDVFGATDQRLVAVVRQAPARLITAAADQPPATRDVPAGGDVAASFWGDVIAVAGDSGVTLLDPLGGREPGFVPLADHPRALAFSPSGHRVYVARRTSFGLAVVDRYERREADGIALPAPAATIRLDPFGRWLLARPALGDSVWVVDLPVKALKGGLETSWAADLPAVGPGGTLVLRHGADIVAYRADSLVESGRVAGGAADLWVVTPWWPRGAGASRPEAAVAAADSMGAEGPLYVQVSVSRNQAWSTEMAAQLERAGLAARVLPPPVDRSHEGYRVVLGPYATRSQAEAIGRKLGRPYWIYQPES